MIPSLDIVIVNWNSGPFLAACLGSIASAQCGALALRQVIVVDNGSNEAPDCPSFDNVPLQVIRNASNRGFAAACNQGAMESTADYILFLNPDTRLFPTTLTDSVGFLEAPAHAGIGILGIRLVDDAGRTQRTCARFPTPRRLIAQSLGLERLFPDWFPPHFMVEWDHCDTRPVDQVIGAFLLIRRDLFERLSGFDERFFVYFDDVDLCRRSWLAGWPVVHWGGAAVFHHGGGTTSQVKDLRLFYNLRSRMLYAGKYFGYLSAGSVMVVTLVIEPMARLVRAFAHGSMREAREVLRGTAMLWGDMPSYAPKVLGRAHARRSVA